MKKAKKNNLNNEKTNYNSNERETIILSNQERDLIIDSLENPPEPNPALLKLNKKDRPSEQL